MNLVSEKILQAICWTLIHSLWQGLLLAVITGLVMVLSKKSSSAFRYNLLTGLFISFIVIVSFTFSRQLQLINATRTAEIIATDNTPALANIYTPEKNIHSNTVLQNYITVFIDYFNAHASLIVAIWFIVFMTKCVNILSGLVNIQRIRHYKISDVPEYWKKKIVELSKNIHIQKQVLLLESAIIKVPVVIGLLKPTILVPLGLLTNLPPQEVESILMHELAHIHRRDYFFNLLQCFIDIIFFFNPAILWISSLIRNERENCCDDIAIDQTKNKKQFVQALVSFHQYNNSVSKYAMPFANRKSRLVNRVRRIVNNDNNTLNPIEKIVLLSSLFIFSIVFINISKGQTNPQKNQEKPSIAIVAKTNSLPKKSVPKQQPPASHLPKANKKYNAGAGAPQEKPARIKDNVDENSDNVSSDQQDANNESEELDNQNISAEQLDQLKTYGANAEFINGFHEIGYKNISSDEIIFLKDHGVSPDFIHAFQQMGFEDISLKKAEELKDHGVSPDLIRGFHEIGYTDISLDAVQELRDHGVDPDYITGFKHLGFKNISLDDARDLRDHGVSVAFVNGFFHSGYNNLSLDKARELKDHGVNIEFINGFKQFGFKNISLDKAIELRDHRVNIEFINNLRKKTGVSLSLDEYIMLRDHKELI